MSSTMSSTMSSAVQSTSTDTLRIRPAEPVDLEPLPGLQMAAGDAFRTIGMGDVADNPPLGVERLASYQRRGHAWVAVSGRQEATGPQGFVIVDLVDGCAHIEQVSVHPAAAGRGVGRRLIDHVDGWAARAGLPALTLSTFREVPWNAPYYRRLGFRELDEAELTPGLGNLLAGEVAFGLDPASRVFMRRRTRQAGHKD